MQAIRAEQTTKPLAGFGNLPWHLEDFNHNCMRPHI